MEQIHCLTEKKSTTGFSPTVSPMPNWIDRPWCRTLNTSDAQGLITRDSSLLCDPVSTSYYIIRNKQTNTQARVVAAAAAASATPRSSIDPKTATNKTQCCSSSSSSCRCCRRRDIRSTRGTTSLQNEAWMRGLKIPNHKDKHAELAAEATTIVSRVKFKAETLVSRRVFFARTPIRGISVCIMFSAVGLGHSFSCSAPFNRPDTASIYT